MSQPNKAEFGLQRCDICVDIEWNCVRRVRFYDKAEVPAQPGTLLHTVLLLNWSDKIVCTSVLQIHAALVKTVLFWLDLAIPVAGQAD